MAGDAQNSGAGATYGLAYQGTSRGGGNAYGIYGFGSADDASSPTLVYGGYFFVQSDTSGTITAGHGVHIKTPVVNSGTITTVYGLRIASQTGGGTNYSIYTEGGTISHGGNLAFRQASTISTTTGNLTINPAADLTITAGGNDVNVNTNNFVISSGTSGDCILYLDADTDNSNEADQPSIVWRQDGNAITASAGFFDSADHFKIKTSHANSDIIIYTQGFANAIYIDNSADSVGIGTSSPEGTLSVDQSSSSGAKAVLLLDQADVDQEFIQFVGTASAGDLTRSIVDEGDQASQTLEGWIKINVYDVGNQITDQDYFIPIYTLSS